MVIGSIGTLRFEQFLAKIWEVVLHAPVSDQHDHICALSATPFYWCWSTPVTSAWITREKRVDFISSPTCSGIRSSRIRLYFCSRRSFWSRRKRGASITNSCQRGIGTISIHPVKSSTIVNLFWLL
jgi:hypothetical protein